ncbi:MAG: glycosyltransferase family 2 protein, partial [Bryobacteraceae bacterium]
FKELGLCDAPVPRTLFKPHSAAAPPRWFHPSTPPTIADEVRNWTSTPVVSVISPVYNVAGPHLRRCIESVRAQWYPFWDLCLCDDGSTNPETLAVLESYRGLDPRIKIVRSNRNEGIAAASNRAAEISTGEYLAMLDDDDEITPDALFEVAKVVHSNPEVEFLYTDEDKIAEDGHLIDHYCKPDWSPEHLLSVMYVLHLLVMQKALFYSVGGFRPQFSGAQDYDLALRASTQARSVCHIPKILYHWRTVAGSAAEVVDAKPAALAAGRRALEDHVAQNGIDADVEEGLLPGLFHVRNRIRGNPLASLCILAGGRLARVEGRGTVDLLANFVTSIVQRTEYPNYEIVVVDDGTLSEDTHRALRGMPHRIEHFTPAEGPFNFSRKANFAFRQARGHHILLLNDDLEAISPEWLTAMLEPLQQRAVGVVGAKLLFPDERLQHVGVVLGVNGGASHVYHGYPANLVGYNAFTHVVRNYSAVTAACLATRADVIEATGGFDEQLGIDYNDIDFCLSAIRRGFRIVYTPYAELYHFEGTSIARQAANARDTMRFQLRWREYARDDHYYNPNLTRNALDFSIDDWAAN